MHHHRSFFLGAIFAFVLGLTITVSRAQERQQEVSKTDAARHAPSNKEEAEEEKVSAKEPVLSLEGYCEPASHPKPCRTEISRSEFEELAEAASANEGPAKSQFAAFYSKFTLLAREAEKRGMDKNPVFRRKLAISRLQLLGQVLIQDLQAKSEEFASGELEKFFQDNPAKFEQAELLRIHIPWTKFSGPLNSVQQPVNESAPEMKALAASTLARARAGADFEALEKEVLGTANLNEESAVNLGKMARNHLRRSHQTVFDLKPGEISPLFEEHADGYYIYKMGARQTPPFDSVKADVAAIYAKQRLDAWIDNITTGVTLNEQYFGSSAVRKGQ